MNVDSVNRRDFLSGLGLGAAAVGLGWAVDEEREQTADDIEEGLEENWRPLYKWDPPVCSIVHHHEGDSRYFLYKNATQIELSNESTCRELADTVSTWTE